MKTLLRTSLVALTAFAATGCTMYKHDQVVDQPVARAQPPEQQPVIVEQTVNPQPEAPQAPDAVTVLKDHPSTFFFASGATGLQPTDYSRLDMIADVLKSSPESKVMIVGFADASGNAEKNLELSQRRSTAVKNYLQAHGVADNQMQVQAKGEEQASSRRANPGDRKVVVSVTS